MRTRSLLTVVLGALIAASLSGCTTNPTTGRSQLSLMSREQEIALGNEAAPQLTEEMGGEVQNAALRDYVTEVGQRLVVHTEADGPQRAWDFTLLDSDVINAFALPGEKVFMSRGLAEKMDNEAQLAGVLGHEIGHVMARHVNERMTSAQAVGIGALVVGVLTGVATDNETVRSAAPALATAGGGLVVLKFSRDQESEADTLGMRYMAKAGYNPEAQMQVMQILARESQGSKPPELFATHPYPETRVDRIRQLMNGEYANTRNNPQYQFFPERYQQRFLSQVSALPAAPVLRERGGMLASVVLEDPTTWCGHCAQAAAAGRRARGLVP